ncbi:MAG: hypothetical protein FWC51_03765 [Proteobacteria bacterium]|nr:hypothetical protein [Pseudomonadota bacterium]
MNFFQKIKYNIKRGLDKAYRWTGVYEDEEAVEKSIIDAADTVLAMGSEIKNLLGEPMITETPPPAKKDEFKPSEVRRSLRALSKKMVRMAAMKKYAAHGKWLAKAGTEIDGYIADLAGKPKGFECYNAVKFIHLNSKKINAITEKLTEMQRGKQDRTLQKVNKVFQKPAPARKEQPVAEIEKYAEKIMHSLPHINIAINDLLAAIPNVSAAIKAASKNGGGFGRGLIADNLITNDAKYLDYAAAIQKDNLRKDIDAMREYVGPFNFVRSVAFVRNVSKSLDGIMQTAKDIKDKTLSRADFVSRRHSKSCRAFRASLTAQFCNTYQGLESQLLYTEKSLNALNEYAQQSVHNQSKYKAEIEKANAEKELLLAALNDKYGYGLTA